MNNGTFASVIQSTLNDIRCSSVLVFDIESEPLAAWILRAMPSDDHVVPCNIDDVSDFLKLGHGANVVQWFAFSIVDEARIRETLARNLASSSLTARIRSCLNDIFLRYLSRDLPFAAGLPNDGRIPNLHLYAIVCAPRCGSTYLVEMLASVGLGRPEEHLRDQEIAALSDLHIGENDGLQLLKEFQLKHQRNCFFGTKLVSHFLFDLLSKVEIPAAIKEFVMANFKVIYLVRRNKARQAVSDFLANKVKVWHVRDNESARMLTQKHSDIEYSFDEILRRYRFMTNEDQKLTQFVNGFDYRVITYEDMICNPDCTFKLLGEFLHFQDIGRPSAAVIKPDSGPAEDFYQRFSSDYLDRFSCSPPDFEPINTARTSGV